MKLIWKLSLPQVCAIFCLCAASLLLIQTSLDEMRRYYDSDIAETQIIRVYEVIERSAENSSAIAAVFSRMPVVLEAYELAMSGDIDDERSPQVQAARSLLRERLAPMLDGYKELSGYSLKLHFHLPNSRSLVRLSQKKHK